MTSTRNLSQFSLKTLLLLPLVALIGFACLRWHFKYSASSVRPGFELDLTRPVVDGNDLARFEDWLDANGYTACRPPEMACPVPEMRESWFIGKHDGIEHYIHVMSDTSGFKSEVVHQAVKWTFQNAGESESEASALDEVMHKLRSWHGADASANARH